ncbi:18033_t:CDS:2, partial [Acaulospora morrowiae]
MDELRRQVQTSNSDVEAMVEFAVYRELIQNADDAKSSIIQIKFQDPESLGKNSLKDKDKCVRIMFKNNGFVFRPEDWNRLKKIAAGNPDVQKIGAFGVGFYSLFSICDEPFVSSGDYAMNFYWKGNQLFTKKSSITQKGDRSWTTFLMDMREPLEFPKMDEFGTFLVSSLGFTGNLQEVSVFFNEARVIHISKKMTMPRSIFIPYSFNTITPRKMFELRSADVREIEFRIETPEQSSSMIFKVASGNLDVHITKEFSEEMERSTKKYPPPKTTIQMMYTDYKNYSSYKNIPEISDLISHPEQGRIFIGFKTYQTTGCSAHFAARVIPTVEREAIDLAEKTLAIYNNEMLCTLGILTRIIYNDHMTKISSLYRTDNEDDRQLLEKDVAHLLAQLTFIKSTPIAQVGNIVKSLFFRNISISSEYIYVLSTHGVKPINFVRIPAPEMEAFIKTVPVIPKIVMETCDTFFKNFQDENVGILRKLDINDVFVELESRVLETEEASALLKWWVDYCNKGDPPVTKDEISKFVYLTVVRTDKDIPFRTIKYFLNPTTISPELEVPSSVIPHSISKSFKQTDLKKWFGSWVELSLDTWVEFIVSKPELEINSDFAEKVLGVIARGINKCASMKQELIKKLLCQKRCIPTNKGMRLPKEAYFPKVNLFPDLPIVSLRNLTPVNDLLKKLNVRSHVDLQLIFDRLVNQGSWNHIRLLKYLVSISSDLKDEDKETLRTSKIWPKQSLQGEQKKTTVSNKEIKFMACELYAPLKEMKEFNLPMISWSGTWSNYNKDAKFLYMLGLREYPPIDVILQLASSKSERSLREKALNYFLKNFREKYSSDYKPDNINVAFLPCTEPDVYETPLGCFYDPGCTAIKFHALRQDLRTRAEELGVRQYPDSKDVLINLSKNPPGDRGKAIKTFDYLASLQSNFSNRDWLTLRHLKFIPITSNNFRLNKVTHNCPRKCFFKGSDTSYTEIFSYVDFGEKANKFLQSCGVREEPSPTDLAEYLLENSEEYWKKTGGDVDKYFKILYIIAINRNRLPSNLVHKMNYAKVLLGVSKGIDDFQKEIRQNKRARIMSRVNDNFLKETRIYSLGCVKDILIGDSPKYQFYFNPLLAPEEEPIEEFYRELGCRALSECVTEEPQLIGVSRNSKISSKLKQVISERAKLFYHGIPPSHVRRSHEWIENLSVFEVKDIKVKYELTTTKEVRVESIKSCFLSHSRDYGTLYIAPGDLDYLGIAANLGRQIYKNYGFRDISHFAMLLTSPLESLKLNGYPVDRILEKRNFEKQKSANQNGGTTKIIDLTSSEYTKNLHDKLRNAVKSCCSNSESLVMFSENFDDTENGSNSCEGLPDSSLTEIGVEGGLQIFAAEGVNPLEIIGTPILTRFAGILKDLSEIFELPLKTIHIFYDPNTSLIAFNRKRALFFNFKFYNKTMGEDSYNDALTSWYLTFCHELAHNITYSHNQEHENYLCSFAELYMPNFLRLISKKRNVY